MGDARKSLVYAFEMLSKTTCYYKKFLRKIRLLSYVSYVCLHDTLQVQDMLEKRKTRTREALALMWCAGQLPEKNLARGLRGLLLLNMHRQL